MNTDAGLARLRSAIDAYRANASAPRWRLSLLADACLETGRIEEALAEAETTAVRYYEAEMYRLKGASWLS